MMNKFSLFMLVATLIWIGGTNYDDHVMAAADSTMADEAAAAESNIWCVANYATSDQALNDIIQYVCGQIQMDCTPIRPGGSCYEPNILYRHASFVMNRYYQVNRQPHECDFSGHAVSITWDPSCGSCYYDRKYK
ncbi:hypothetical protein MKW94_010060 [Papaver nudicaule]|uniref:X8 domain-containing protein n=1 Tax=Papaver nudicaule TaxID=74823 RepID=A0AA42B0L5_PAPNU|nr:hypothetical protein [Papaver nudicaule]